MPALHLPTTATPFVGREAELATIQRFFADSTCRLISLVGLGGIGKTRLAIEAARLNADYFPDGIFFVPLQPLQLPELILPTIAEAMHIASSPGIDLEQQLISFLGDKRRLLILDSFEHLLPGVGAVTDLIQSTSEVKFLITSREKLNTQYETVLSVGSLTYPEQETLDNVEQYSAVTMFLSLFRRLEPELPVTPQILADASLICRQIRGLPLAIELAVGWADILSLSEIAQEITRSFDFLETRRRDSPERHRNIRAVLDPSLQTLSDDDCAVFERLCVFRGSFTREAAEAIAGASLHSLGSLVNKSLIRHLPTGRYEIHELVRQYGEMRLNSVAGQREAAQERHCIYYANFLAAQRQAMRVAVRNAPFERMDAESANFIVAFSLMTENRHVALIWQCMYGFANYCLIRARYSEGMILFRRCVEVFRDDPANEVLIGNLLAQLGFFLTILDVRGESEEGVRLLEEGMTILEKHRDDLSVETFVSAYIIASLNYYFALKPQPMKEIAQKGLAYASERNDGYGIRYLMGYLAIAECLLGNFDVARQLGNTCYNLALDRGDFWLQGGMAGMVLGQAAYTQADYAEARCWYQIALQCFYDLHQFWTIASTASMLTACAIALRDFADAQTQLNVCLRYFEENGTVWEIPTMLLSIASLFAQQNMTEQAVEMLPSVLSHPACRKATHDKAAALLHQLEAMLPTARFTAAWEHGQLLQPTQVITDLAAVVSGVSEQGAVTCVLSERELEVLRLVADGLSNAEIAQTLFLSVGTVKVHVRHIFDKLDAENRTEAVAAARKRGIL